MAEGSVYSAAMAAIVVSGPGITARIAAFAAEEVAILAVMPGPETTIAAIAAE